MLIAFAGTKGSGKDEAIRGILASSRYSGGKRFAFAGRLKAIAREVWHLTEDHTDGERKERPLPWLPGRGCAHPSEVQMDAFLPEMRRLTGLDIQPRGKVATTPRELMQFLGTDYVRSIEPNYWVCRLVEDVMDFQFDYPDHPALVCDCRFPNEVAAIRSIGGRVVRVVRPGLPKGPYSDHPSETGIATLDVDAEIVNVGTITDLHRAALAVMPW